MKNLTVFIYFLSIIQVLSTALAAEKVKPSPIAKSSASVCSADKITEFKNEYIKLQNALNYEGDKIELVNGKAKVVADSEESDNSQGRRIEEALYKQYTNALIKVGKIYQQLNKKDASTENKKLLKDNPALVQFFKTIDENTTTQEDKLKIDPKLKMDALIKSLENVKISGFELTPGDSYLLKKLLVHSQDRICTLEKYEKNKNRKYIAHLAQLKPLNKMIMSLKMMNKTAELNLEDVSKNLSLENLSNNKKLEGLIDQDKAISLAINDSMKKLREFVIMNKGCIKKLVNGPQLGDHVQTCNYKKFIASLSSSNFNQIESILHFLNANQQAEHARTDLKWLSIQFKQESKPIVPPVGPPAAKTCNKDSCEKMTGEEIVKWDEKDKTCYRTPIGKERTKICSEAMATEPVVAEVKLEGKALCDKNDADWIAGAISPEVRTSKFIWDGKSCNDKNARKTETVEEHTPEEKPDMVYPNGPVPGRFQPINIPTRQVYILPGMP